jgi:hypothetical protein
MGPSRLNQQRLLSMSRHHQLTPSSLPGESWQMIEAGAAVVDSRRMAAAICFIGGFHEALMRRSGPSCLTPL